MLRKKERILDESNNKHTGCRTDKKSTEWMNEKK